MTIFLFLGSPNATSNNLLEKKVYSAIILEAVFYSPRTETLNFTLHQAEHVHTDPPAWHLCASFP